MRLLRALAARGHSVSVWLDDYEGRHALERPERTRSAFREFFDSGDLALHTDLSAWAGADVVLATGWQTVPRVLLLPARARAYLVQDHEPEFYPTSAESLWAAWTYRQGLHCIAASRWLAGLLSRRYGARATHFDLAVDHDVYRPSQGSPRREDLVVFYARSATPRRAVPLGLAALERLATRRPDVEITLFGEASDTRRGSFRQAGVLTPRRLAGLYSSATVGVVLSLTNPSLIALEMSACELPCVELATDAMVDTFGADGHLLLAEPTANAICEAIEELLDDSSQRASRSQRGHSWIASRTWDHAAGQVSSALSTILAEGHG